MQGKKTPVDTREMALAMLRAGKTYRQISNTLEIGIATIHTIAKQMEEVDLDHIVKEIKRGYVARNLMLAEYIAESIPSMCSINANIKDVAIAMGILTDKAMKMEYSINEQNRPQASILQTARAEKPGPQPDRAEKPGPQPDRAETPGILKMDSTGKTTAIARPQSERDKLVAEGYRLLEECHPPIE